MVDVRPFAGFRFNPARVGKDLTSVACPPYDVISPAERAALVAQDPHNFVRLELPEEITGDPSPLAKYERTASEYAAWQSEGVLTPESAPALYAYRQRFTIDGTPRERRGFIAALRLEPWDTRAVRPHEKTHSGPKEDRLHLIQACRANFSPIWVLYRDPSDGTARLWDAVEEAEPNAVAQDRDGYEHAVWALTDQELYRPLLEALRDGSVYIADGHHRYETALHYRAERQAASAPWSEDAAANFAMTYFVEMTDPGLIIHGTHRMISAPEPLAPAAIQAVLDRWFDFTPVTGTADALLTTLERAPQRPGFAVWAPELGLSGIAVLRDAEVPDERAPGRSRAWRRLDLAALHALAVDELFPQGTAALFESGNLWYSRLLPEVVQAIESGSAELAFLVRETPAEQVIGVADAADLMPEKSTYFYPKPLSGLVTASLDGDIPPVAAR
jgi:uncharacterized protein (DUF1015 family)